MTLRSLAALSLLALLGAGCDRTPAGAETASYTLVAVNGRPLPAPESEFTETTAGSLALRDDGTHRTTLTARCRRDLPPGWECQIDGSGEQRYTGPYSRSEGWLRFEGPVGSVTFAAAFARDEVTLSLACAPSHAQPGCPRAYTFRR